jgi:hypothetical protein
MDEDKFYWGETLDGRAGLVPSNFVQRVGEKELRELVEQAAAMDGTTMSQAFNPQQQQQSAPNTNTNNSNNNNRRRQRHCPAVPSTSAAAANSFVGDDGGARSCESIAPFSFPASSSSPFASSSLANVQRPNSPSFVLALPHHLAQISHDFSESDCANGAAHSHAHAHQQPPLPNSVLFFPPSLP